ncbi:hypothetical protein DLAC_01692 [Tieghemostelium lacteum]|uniref:PH domain-containing protein n=1 Tax=Tieghemostelium lacteum TaxID=361077 RepID=A0A152A6J1_TIELA|nr:hypothetical protein DLAC_01692 [Tieghemostelium lacteum]|eukprot:KYR01687.1 hypothetical protein DLAC_01692 [Tieghemostelium lacteum]
MGSTLEQYLKYIGLETYLSLMVENGYDDPDIISELTEDDLVNVGIKRGHAKRAFLKAKELSSTGSGTTSASNSSAQSGTTTSTGTTPTQSPPLQSSGGSSTGKDENRKSRMIIGKKDEESDDDEESVTPVQQDGPMLQSRVIYEGIIQKKGAEGFFGSKVYQKRYFKLYEEARLAYYKHANEVSPINIIELRGALACEDMDGKNFAFKLTMKTSARVYYLVAPNAEAKHKWIQSIKQFILPPIVPKKMDHNQIMPYLQNYEDPPQALSSRFDSPLSWDVIEKPIAENDIRLHIHSKGVIYVEETRKIEIPENGIVWIHNLPKSLDEKSVHFLSLSDPSAFLVEQTYYNDAKTPEKMLEKLIGKVIEVHVPRDDHFDEPLKFKGTLLYLPTESKYALHNQESNAVHFLQTKDLISYNLLDNKLETIFRNPSLEWMIKSQEKSHLMKLSYNSLDLFKWFASYVAVLNPKETEMELRGFFTIENNSGKTYENTNLVLIREPEEPVKPKEEEKKDESPLPLPKLGGFKLGKLPGLNLLGASKPPPPPEKRTYRYNCEHKTTLKNGESKQIGFVSAKVPVKSIDHISFKTPKYTKYSNTDKNYGTDAKEGIVNSTVIFTWDQPFSLPSGQMKLQRQLKDGFGSDILNTFELGHYNSSDIIVLPLQPLGRVSATRVQTGFNFDMDQLYCVETFEIKVQNGREEPIRVIVEESLYRGQFWEITYSNPKHSNHPTHPRKINWTLTIPPLDGVTIAYTSFTSALEIPASILKAHADAKEAAAKKK